MKFAVCIFRYKMRIFSYFLWVCIFFLYFIVKMYV